MTRKAGKPRIQVSTQSGWFLQNSASAVYYAYIYHKTNIFAPHSTKGQGGSKGEQLL